MKVLTPRNADEAKPQYSQIKRFIPQPGLDGIQADAESRSQTAHRERHNNSKIRQIFQIGDAVTARITLQSNAEIGTVDMLSYREKGPFQIVKVLDADSYEVQNYGDPSSAKRKYKGTDLFILPPAIFPSEPLETTDYKYLNFEHVPLVNPLKKYHSGYA